MIAMYIDVYSDLLTRLNEQSHHKCFLDMNMLAASSQILKTISTSTDNPQIASTN